MGVFSILKKIKHKFDQYFPNKWNVASAGKNAHIEFPVYMASPESVYIEEDTRIRQGSKILNQETNKVTIKRYSVISMNCMIITNKHNSTVGIPQILLGISGINDEFNDVVIGEDVWVGANVTIMGGANLGRGCICGACSTVTKEVPPYALVVGSPARIVGVKFSIEQIIEHEKVLYPEEERYSREYLENLFVKYYQDKKVFGVTTEFTQQHIDRLKECAKSRRYTDKDYFEKLASLRLL